MHLVVGLGNPGEKYEKTRHNLGFRVIDELALRHQIKKFKSKCQSNIADIKVADHKVILAQPQTFMNNSGLAVRGLIDWFKVDINNLILIYDDVDLEVGQLRLREKGNAGGHNGVQSVIDSLGTNQFSRVRIGIGREELGVDVSDYVLKKIPSSERDSLDEAIIDAAEAVEAVLIDGLSAAMNKFNS